MKKTLIISLLLLILMSFIVEANAAAVIAAQNIREKQDLNCVEDNLINVSCEWTKKSICEFQCQYKESYLVQKIDYNTGKAKIITFSEKEWQQKRENEIELTKWTLFSLITLSMIIILLWAIKKLRQNERRKQ